MKDFKSFIQNINESKNNIVMSKKIDGIKTEIQKQGSNFVAYIDGDKLDSYSSQKEAEKMISQFIKQYKG